MSNDNIRSLNLFAGEEHQPFHWHGGTPAVLLLHGFMGSPAEMRPLAKDLHESGWTVEGLLLPGFGAQIDTLFERRYQEWLEATRSALISLAAKHQPVLLAGYSIGGAIALSVAAKNPPDGLILLAPFWRFGSTKQHLIWQVVKRIFPRLKPFMRADFSDSRTSTIIDGLIPDIDLADPKAQEVLRQLRVPARFVDDLFSVGKLAKQSVALIDIPTLIIQGREDEAVRPAATRQLLQKFSGPVSYKELPVGHDLVLNQHLFYSHLVQAVLNFAQMHYTEEISLAL